MNPHDDEPAADSQQLTTLALSSPSFLGWAATLGDPNPYLPARFHHLIAAEIVEVLEGRLDTLLVETAVQHGKSELCSVLTPALFLGLHPERSVIAASYASEFAADRIGRKTRDFIERHGARFFKPESAIDAASNARDRFNTLAGGGMLTAGVDKGVAGRRADLILVDDPYSGIEQAMSKAHRAKVWNWYQSELATRLAPGGGQIVVCSRWHERDFVAQMIEHCTSIGARFKVIDMPALAICTVCGSYGVNEIDECGHGDAGRDELGRLPGEELWSVRDREFLLSQRKMVGSRSFDALYQARPRAEEGTVFLCDHFRFASLEETAAGKLIRLDNGTPIALSDCRTFAMTDLAFTQNASSDFFCIGVFASAPTRDLIVLDVIRAKCSMQQQVQLIKNALAKWPISRVGVEVVGAQQYFLELCQAEGLPVKAVKATSAKEVRADVAAALFEAGRVHFINGTSWLDDVMAELLGFPSAAHDDAVDCLSMAAAVMNESETYRDAPALTLRARGGIQIGGSDFHRGSQFVAAGATRIL
jgi:predicted phage terminase large subunit-like protein